MPAYRRSIFLIDRKFQLKFSFYVCSWLFALSVVYPIIIYSLFDYFVQYITVRDPLGPSPLALVQRKHEVTMLLVLFQGIVLLVTFMISIFLSHRIAGPLYKLKKFFREAREGKISDDLHFRKADHFQDVAAEYNNMMSGIREIMDQGKSSLAEAIVKIEKGDSEGALTLLKEAQEKFPH